VSIDDVNKPTLIEHNIVGNLTVLGANVTSGVATVSERLATTLGVYYTTYYVVMAVMQLAAGAVRDVFGSPAAPIVFAALVMTSTIVGFGVFRLVDQSSRR
jgi:hypothetical protein